MRAPNAILGGARSERNIFAGAPFAFANDSGVHSSLEQRGGFNYDDAARDRGRIARNGAFQHRIASPSRRASARFPRNERSAPELHP
jgi:hypothetical protein